MISYLKGKVQEIGDLHLILDVHGVGFLVNTSNVTNQDLKLGEEAFLLTELIIRENLWQMYGFINETEKALFLLLNKVQGVGAKAALSILSVIKYDQLGHVIKNKDIAQLCLADGVGEKLASRIANELHKKIPDSLLVLGAHSNVAMNTPKVNMVQQDVISALVNLGFKQYEIKKAMEGIEDKALGFEDMFKMVLGKLRG